MNMRKNNRILMKRRNKVKNEALELRDQLERNPHYNIFVGDESYKTDFWLTFTKTSSTTKYQRNIKRRFKNLLKILIGCQLIWLVLAYICK